MNESTITVQGYVGSEPVLRTAGGHPVAGFRVACTPRRLNRATGEWADAPTQWYSVTAWRQLGVNVHQSLKKGDPVVVHGRLSARSYVNKDGLEVNTFEVEALTVGHDLNRGRSMLMKNERRPQDRPTAGVHEQPEPHDQQHTGQSDEQSDALAGALADWGARQGPPEVADTVAEPPTGGTLSGGAEAAEPAA